MSGQKKQKDEGREGGVPSTWNKCRLRALRAKERRPHCPTCERGSLFAQQWAARSALPERETTLNKNKPQLLAVLS